MIACMMQEELGSSGWLKVAPQRALSFPGRSLGDVFQSAQGHLSSAKADSCSCCFGKDVICCKGTGRRWHFKYRYDGFQLSVQFLFWNNVFEQVSYLETE